MSLHPCLRYRDARKAMDFLERAFGFEPREVHEDPSGRVVHCEMLAAGEVLMFGDAPEEPDRWGDRIGLGWTYVAVPEVDSIYASAKAAGAEITMEPTDQDYGSRDFSARDHEGNQWSFGTYQPVT